MQFAIQNHAPAPLAALEHSRDSRLAAVLDYVTTLADRCAGRPSLVVRLAREEGEKVLGQRYDRGRFTQVTLHDPAGLDVGAATHQAIREELDAPRQLLGSSSELPAMWPDQFTTLRKHAQENIARAQICIEHNLFVRALHFAEVAYVFSRTLLEHAPSPSNKIAAVEVFNVASALSGYAGAVHLLAAGRQRYAFASTSQALTTILDHSDYFQAPVIGRDFERLLELHRAIQQEETPPELKPSDDQNRALIDFTRRNLVEPFTAVEGLDVLAQLRAACGDFENCGPVRVHTGEGKHWYVTHAEHGALVLCESGDPYTGARKSVAPLMAENGAISLTPLEARTAYEGTLVLRERMLCLAWAGQDARAVQDLRSVRYRFDSIRKGSDYPFVFMNILRETARLEIDFHSARANGAAQRGEWELCATALTDAGSAYRRSLDEFGRSTLEDFFKKTHSRLELLEIELLARAPRNTPFSLRFQLQEAIDSQQFRAAAVLKDRLTALGADAVPKRSYLSA